MARKQEIPANDNAEFALCGGLVDSPADVADVRELVDPSDFTHPKLGRLFEEIVNRFDGGLPKMTGPTIKTILGDEFSVTIREFIDRAEYRSSNLPDHARAIADAPRRPRLIDLNQKAIECLKDPQADAQRIFARQIAAMESIAATGEADHVKYVPRFMNDYLAAFDNAEAKPIGISTCIGELDERYGKLMPGQLAVLAARTSIGKTQYAIQIAMEAAKENRAVLFVTLEMGADELLDRILGSIARINPMRLANGRSKNLEPDERRSLAEAANEVGQLPLTIYEPPSTTVASLRGVSRVWQAKTDTAGLIVVDYLQLMTASDPKKNRNDQVGEVSRGLKALARETKLPVLALAQLNRKADESNEPPRLSHLRESGAIEQDANRVYFLHRPEFENAQGYRMTKDTESAQIIVAKNRGGPVGCIDVEFKQCVGFREIGSQWEHAFDDFNNEDSDHVEAGEIDNDF